MPGLFTVLRKFCFSGLGFSLGFRVWGSFESLGVWVEGMRLHGPSQSLGFRVEGKLGALGGFRSTWGNWFSTLGSL